MKDAFILSIFDMCKMALIARDTGISEKGESEWLNGMTDGAMQVANAACDAGQLTFSERSQISDMYWDCRDMADRACFARRK